MILRSDGFGASVGRVEGYLSKVIVRWRGWMVGRAENRENGTSENRKHAVIRTRWDVGIRV